MEKSWKLYDRSKWKLKKFRWSLLATAYFNIKVTALIVLQDDVKYISKEKFLKTYFSKETF